MWIILNYEEAQAVSGKTDEGYALQPVLLLDGVTYVLPERVVDDPAHLVHSEFLRGLPTREVSDDEFSKEEI